MLDTKAEMSVMYTPFILLFAFPFAFWVIIWIITRICYFIYSWATKGMIDADQVEEAKIKWLMKDLGPMPEEFDEDKFLLLEYPKAPVVPDAEQRAQEANWLGYDPYKDRKEGLQERIERIHRDHPANQARCIVADQQRANIRAAWRGDADY